GVGKVKVPSVRISDASIKEVTFEIEFFVNNTHNALGGKLDSVEYAVYMSGSRDGDYSFVGNGSMGQVTVPPSERTTEVGGFEAEYSDIVSAVGSSAVESEGSLYARVEGEASIRLGPFGFSVPFEETRRVIQND
ncbi:MAG: hypothetical protein SV760_00305, partial [Halobacteria archaeon]|nr:hypothetical protein [Halobacteria archaeon]